MAQPVETSTILNAQLFLMLLEMNKHTNTQTNKHTDATKYIISPAVDNSDNVRRGLHLRLNLLNDLRGIKLYEWEYMGPYYFQYLQQRIWFRYIMKSAPEIWLQR